MMTKSQADAIAHRAWERGEPGRIGYRYGMTCLRSKKVELRCEVGYHDVLDHGAGNAVRVTVMGRGRTWEEALAAAGITP